MSNGISTIVGYLMLMSSLLKWQQWYYVTYSRGVRGLHTLTKDIKMKVNIKAGLEFELAYFEDVVEHFSQYTTATSLRINILTKG